MNDDFFDDFFIEYDLNYESSFYELENEIQEGLKLTLDDWIYLYLHIEYLITEDENFELKYKDYDYYEPDTCYTLFKDNVKISEMNCDKSINKLTHTDFLNYLNII